MKNKGSFIINKKSSIKSSKLFLFENLLFEDVPLAAKQAYLECLEKQINDLDVMRKQLNENIQKQEMIKKQQLQFRKEIENIQNDQQLDHNIINQSMLLSQFISEQQKIDTGLIEQSYLKDLEYLQNQQLKTSNQFVPFENEFL
ncbi:unnamed protein product (macronuclear) [Paramecium tetraurelia]|uniref:Uncharacterized protein n=1 Tax=Paramecium tetraurelia TaxID=5888 RepID=A0D0A6_PARTE|nr:uncharacterized protein GSPATT00012025001 [Paramecium tetraurelia]CAK76473.1 unnamed protein product [Paramecium tetraurelia]|eukprot:XP_001443870.1 hypothetical protein (macronuclear) [Paramecium tetraurelia strain d4-2]